MHNDVIRRGRIVYRRKPARRHMVVSIEAGPCGGADIIAWSWPYENPSGSHAGWTWRGGYKEFVRLFDV